MKHLLVALLSTLAIRDASAGPAASTAPRLTESQQILAKVMDDIRRCDKSVRYQYDSRTRTLSPPELGKIKGLKLKKLSRESAEFEVNESYGGLSINALTVGRPNAGHKWPNHYVAFRESFSRARERLQQIWQLQFEDGIRPGPDVIYGAQYAEISMTVDGKQRFLSIEALPIKGSRHSHGAEVGCNHVDV